MLPVILACTEFERDTLRAHNVGNKKTYRFAESYLLCFDGSITIIKDYNSIPIVLSTEFS